MFNSGSGAIGIEALSRGANSAIFVENNIEAFNCINDNLEKTRLQDKAKVYKLEVEQVLDKLANAQFDIIFIDPPYHYQGLENIIHTILTNQILKTGGKLIIENASDVEDIIHQHLNLIKFKAYKTTKINIYERI